MLAEQFLRQFPQQAAFLDGLLSQYKLDPTRHLPGIMDLASLYDPASLEQALGLAHQHHTSADAFVRGPRAGRLLTIGGAVLLVASIVTSLNLSFRRSACSTRGSCFSCARPASA